MENRNITTERMAEFRLPRYKELPDVGLYLEQVVKYINGFLEPLGCLEITPSMVSNYVKKKLIDSPVKKQYNASQLAELFFVALAKSVLSIDNIGIMFDLMKKTYTHPVAYDYFCTEFENRIFYIFGIKEKVAPSGVTTSEIKNMLDEVIGAMVNIIHLEYCFEAYHQNSRQ